MRHLNEKPTYNKYNGEEFGIFSGERLRQNLVKKDPIVEGILYENDVICISAYTGKGKSILALQLMCCLTTGAPFLGTQYIPHPFNVLYLQTEGDRAETIERLEAMNEGVAIDDSRWIHINLAGICLNTSEGLNQLLALCKSAPIKVDVVIVDPLYTTMKGTMSSDSDTTEWIRNLREFKKQLYPRCAFILIGHEGHEIVVQGKAVKKSKDRLFGSYAWGNFVNYNYKMEIVNGRHVLESGKIRNTKAIDILEMRMIEPVPLMYVHANEDTSSAEYKALAALDFNEPRGASIITKNTNLSRATVYRVLNKLLVASKIEEHTNNFGKLYTKISLDGRRDESNSDGEVA